MSRIVSGIVILIIIYPFQTVIGQNSTTEVDSTFENYMNKAWEEIREAEFSDSLQNAYSKEFYYYYKENPNSETGRKAFAQAFNMWGNTGNSNYLNEALETLDYDSELWRMIILPMGGIYFRNEDLGAVKYYEFLDYLAENLSEPKSRSEVLLELLRRNSDKEGESEQAIAIARELVELDAHELYVNQGLGFLHEFESLNIGQKAPNFDVITIDGNEISLSDLKGKYVLLEFWATWCGPCIPEIPHLKTLHEKYGSENFTIIGISLDSDKKTLSDFIEERGMEWIQVHVEDGWESEVSRLFNVAGIPRMYLLDPDGVIVARDLRGEQMVSKVESLIQEL